MNALELADFYEPQSSQVAAMLRKQDAAIKQLREALEMSLRVFVNQGWEHDLVAAKKAHTALAATEEFK